MVYRFLITILLLFATSCRAFSSLAGLESLLETEVDSTIAQLHRYVRVETARMGLLKHHAKRYIATVKRLANVQSEHLDLRTVENPIDAFLAIKRCTRDWPRIQRLMAENRFGQQIIGEITIIRRTRHLVDFPENEDMKGVAVAITRLQRVYHLSTADLVRGSVDGEETNRTLDAEDCLEIGGAAFHEKEYLYAAEWADAALKRGEGNEPKGKTGKILTLLREAKDELLTGMATATVDRESTPNSGGKGHPDLEENAQRLCRREQQISTESDSKLNCYLKNDKPFLKLAPAKVELLHFSPLVALFRDVLSIRQIEKVQQIAKAGLKDVSVFNAQTGSTMVVPDRISQSAWLPGSMHPLIVHINKRLSEITNLDWRTAEHLQVASYGIGGYYHPHHDFYTGDSLPPKFVEKGNRIATAMIYMSRPRKGGRTAFPELDLSVQPSVGDVLFWYNLQPDGNPDFRTLHAACPVLTGHKWVSNKWFHERGQEFTRPCPIAHAQHTQLF